MLWRVLSFDLTSLFHTERSWHAYWFSVGFVSGRQDWPSDANLTLFFGLNKGFSLFNFLQSASWIWITKSDFLLFANVMVSCNVLTSWANNLECQMNLMGLVCVLSNWRNKFQIKCSERRVFLHDLSLELFWCKVLTPGRSLLSNPFNSTSAAFLFWFLLWFACILAF